MTGKVILFEKEQTTKETREIFGWLCQVQQDPAISSSGFELAFVIMQHVNRSVGYAWPTHETLAHAINTSDRTVRTLIETLAANGHIAVEHSRGRHNPNRYRLIFKDTKNRKPTSGIEPQKEEVDFRLNDEKQETDFRFSDKKQEVGFQLSDHKTGNSLHENRKFSAQKPEAHFRQNHPIEPTYRTNAVPAAGAALSEIEKTQSPKSSQAEKTPEADLFRRGKEILGQSAGGLISNLLKAKGRNVALARSVIELAATKDSPREYLGAIIRGRDSPEDLRARGEAW